MPAPKGRLFGAPKFAIPAKTQEVALQIDKPGRAGAADCIARDALAEPQAGFLRSLVEMDGLDASWEA